MKVLSLFDGISAGQVALQKSGIQVDTYYASEIDKHAIKVTQNNFPNTIQLNPNVFFMLENVMMKKEYEDVITEFMYVNPIKINSDLVSAQNRKRIYMVSPLVLLLICIKVYHMVLLWKRKED